MTALPPFPALYFFPFVFASVHSPLAFILGWGTPGSCASHWTTSIESPSSDVSEGLEISSTMCFGFARMGSGAD